MPRCSYTGCDLDLVTMSTGAFSSEEVCVCCDLEDFRRGWCSHHATGVAPKVDSGANVPTGTSPRPTLPESTA